MDIIIISFVMYAALHDIKCHRIPNWVCFCILFTGFLDLLFFNDLDIYTAILGLFIGFAICIPLYMVNLFGAGDAKLLASLGITVGYPNIIPLILTAVMFSGLLSLLRLICYGELTEMVNRWKLALFMGVYEKPEVNSVASGAVPMGGAILLAYMYCYFYLF